MKIWMVSREYAGIAEAGGVKNVVCSLSEELALSGNEVTVFIPEYGCTDFSKVSQYCDFDFAEYGIKVNHREFKLRFAKGISGKVNFVFVKSECFKEKFNVYTYCQQDLLRFPDAECGTGYADALYLDNLFELAVCVFGKLSNSTPDVVHCHDACTASLPAMAKILYAQQFENTKFVVSIHNAGPAYHHEFSDINQAVDFTGLPCDVCASSLNGTRVEPYILASHYSKLSTVSYDYARELLDYNNLNTDGLSQVFNSRKVEIDGITNGIDIARYTPEDKNISLLPFEYSPSEKNLAGKYECRKFFMENYGKSGNTEINIAGETIRQFGYLDADPENKNVYISFHGRLVRQKGILVIIELFDLIFSKYSNIRFIINGQGEKYLQNLLAEKAEQYPGKIVYLCGYEKSLARLCTASGDFALFPSEFEPCGLEDFIAQIYGTIPVAHATGGLKKIVNGVSGFTYSPNTKEALFEALSPLVDNKLSDSHYYDELVKSSADYIKENYTWKTVANDKYMPLYRK